MAFASAWNFWRLFRPEFLPKLSSKPEPPQSERCKVAGVVLAFTLTRPRTNMYFEQFYLGCLAHASYMLASEGEAVVVDPQRDVEIYLAAAETNHVSIRHIFETHLHADFVSGHRELAARTGARIYMGEQAEATFPHAAVRDGFRLQVGKVRITALETP